MQGPTRMGTGARERARRRGGSRIITRSIIRTMSVTLSMLEKTLTQACLAANRDPVLEMEIDAWQSFEDGMEE